MNKDILTYEKSGVNIKAADRFVNFLSSKTEKTKKNRKFNSIGDFSSINKIPKKFKYPHLVTIADGVNTKFTQRQFVNSYLIFEEKIYFSFSIFRAI